MNEYYGPNLGTGLFKAS